MLQGSSICNQWTSVYELEICLRVYFQLKDQKSISKENVKFCLFLNMKNFLNYFYVHILVMLRAFKHMFNIIFEWIIFFYFEISFIMVETNLRLEKKNKTKKETKIIFWFLHFRVTFNLVINFVVVNLALIIFKL